MFRVLYRFPVRPGAEQEFIACWQEVTRHIQRSAPGARGSVLLRAGDPGAGFVALARWQSREAWAASRDPANSAVPPLLKERMNGLLREAIAHETFDELIDFAPVQPDQVDD